MTSVETTTAAVRRRARRKRAGRTVQVRVNVAEAAWARVEGRSERAGLALSAWVGFLVGEVLAGGGEVSEAQLETVTAARVGVARIGQAVNSIAATEHLGTQVDEAQLEAVLGRLAARVGEAVAAVMTPETTTAGAGEQAPVVGARGSGRGRRSHLPQPRGRVITVWFSPVERAAVEAAAAAEGLSAGAWVGALVEDPGVIRPLRGEVWGAVFALRKALRRVATNLTQIEAVRASRRAPVPAGVVVARGQVEDAIRACLDAQAVLSGQAGAGAAA